MNAVIVQAVHSGIDLVCYTLAAILVALAAHRLRWPRAALAVSGAAPMPAFPASGAGPVGRADDAASDSGASPRRAASPAQGDHTAAGGMASHHLPDGGTGPGCQAPAGWPREFQGSNG